MKVDEVKALGRALLLSRANVNNCSTLLSFLSSSFRWSASLECLVEAVRCLHAFFLPILQSDSAYFIARNSSESTACPQDAETVYKTWLKSKYQEFLQTLITLVTSKGDVELQSAALDALMELIQVGKFQQRPYFELSFAMVNSSEFNGKVFDIIVTDYFSKKNICQLSIGNFYKLVLQRLGKKLKDDFELRDGDKEAVSMDVFVRNTYETMCKLSAYVQGVSHSQGKSESKTAADKSREQDEVKDLKSKMKKVWISFLQLPLPLDLYKRILTDMSNTIIPSMSNPMRLSDFLIKSYDIGGLFSIMSLDGLFILMTKHDLEYPEFYDKLYSLLEPSMFFTKYRTRFFELMDTCLKSPLLPAYLAAAFAKKLSRLSLSASPAGSLLIIALIHNLLRRHPSINFLVHQHSNATSADGEQLPGVDPFRPSEPKTSECCAMKSSLWEIESLRRHYCPAVSRFVASLEADLTVRAKTTEVEISDFSSGSYSSIFREESRRRLKQVPLAYYKVPPCSLFPGNQDDDFKGWRFDQNIDVGEKKRRLV